MLIYNGAVVAAWGYYAEIEPIASVRKSLVNALHGIAVHNETIDTSTTFADLGINDKPPLTKAEKHAKVIDLLSSRSGVYHRATAETPMTEKPERGSVKPRENSGITTIGILMCWVPSMSRKPTEAFFMLLKN